MKYSLCLTCAVAALCASAISARFAPATRLSNPKFIRSAVLPKNKDKVKEQLLVQCEINGHSIPAIIDTGAQISIMSEACARRCCLESTIDRRFSGTAVGVGEGRIIGKVPNMPIRMGPIAFNSGVAVLQNSRVDFIIGMDVLNMFESEINIKERWMKLRAEDKAYKIPFTSHSLNKAISTDESNRNHWTLDRPSSAMSWIPSLSGGARANGSPAVSDDAPDAAASISLEGV